MGTRPPGVTAKAFIVQIHHANASITNSAGAVSSYRIHQTDCTRFWVQGVVLHVKGKQQFILDDSTGHLQVDMKTFRKNIPSTVSFEVQPGAYVMVVGPMVAATGSITAHQVMLLDTNSKYQREALWWLEVMEYWQVAASTQID